MFCHFERSEKSQAILCVYYYKQFQYCFYTGVTNDLARRIYEHKNKLVEGFTKKYNVYKLVYFEKYSDVRDALTREKQIKDYRREKKVALIKNKISNLKN